MLSDAEYDSITVELLFTKGAACVPDGLIEALENLNLRFNLKRPSDSGTVVFASTEANNLTRIDSEGGIYTPGFKQVVIPSTVLNIGPDMPPGEEVSTLLDVSGLSDPINALKELNITYNPATVGINETGRTINNGKIRIGFTRVDYGQSAPYPPVVITISGAVYEFAQPEPAA